MNNTFANATMVIRSYFLMLLLQSATVKAKFPKEKNVGPKIWSVGFLKSLMFWIFFETVLVLYTLNQSHFSLSMLCGVPVVDIIA